MEFQRSVGAQMAALCVVETAKNAGLLNGPITVAPMLAEAEKELFLKMFEAVNCRRADGIDSIHPDEISSMFSFVFARSAEAVTNMFNGQANKFEMLGLFDGKIPFYTDDDLTAYFKKLTFPADCAQAYWDWYHTDYQDNGTDPVLPLFEALKWTFRLGCHIAITHKGM
ncbi:MAG: hypothetical protein IJW17_03115 [Lentisphaeria bacterium]|jgi:hypothetical protein|nr:hypothetical protein [Lentisphaeria bacterium]